MLHLISLKLYYVKTSFFFFIPSVKGVFSLTFFVTEISTKSVHSARGNIVCTKFKIL